jgi:hypothetical protein
VGFGDRIERPLKFVKRERGRRRREWERERAFLFTRIFGGGFCMLMYPCREYRVYCQMSRAHFNFKCRYLSIRKQIKCFTYIYIYIYIYIKYKK